MKKAKKILIYTGGVLMGLYLLVMCHLYYNQEDAIFHPEVLAKDYVFPFKCNFEEISIPVDKNVQLSGVLFKAKNPKGLIFYLHGNGGSVNGRGNDADVYTSCGYDLFVLDYRGYGKSGGHIESEAQVNSDMQKAYNFMMKRYKASNIVVAGYSIGTGPATVLAADNHPKMLILQAPYYSLTRLIDEKIPIIPDFIKRYRFKTCDVIGKVQSPVYLFHGLQDRLIPYEHSVLLKKQFCPKANLILLRGAGHNKMNQNLQFIADIKKILQ